MAGDFEPVRDARASYLHVFVWKSGMVQREEFNRETNGTTGREPMRERRGDVARYPRPQDPDTRLALEHLVPEQPFENQEPSPNAWTESMAVEQRGRCAGFVELSSRFIHASACR